MEAEMEDKIQHNLKEEKDMKEERGDDLADPLSCETDLKTSKSESFDQLMMLIKIDKGCHKSTVQCSICYLEFSAKEDLKSHAIEAHLNYGADHPTGFQQKVETNKLSKFSKRA